MRLAIEPVHFGIMRVNNGWEDEWLMSRSPAQAESWESDKQRFAALFQFEFAQTVGPAVMLVPPSAGETAALVVRPVVTAIEPRPFIYMSDARNVVDMTVQLVTRDGRVVDEVVMLASPSATLYEPTITQALETAARQLGRRYADHLRERVEQGGAAMNAPASATVSAPATVGTATSSGAPWQSVTSSTRHEGSSAPPASSAMDVNALPPVRLTVASDLLAPRTPIARITRRARTADTLLMWGYAFGTVGAIGGVATWLILGAILPSSLGASAPLEQAGYGAIPLVGPFIGAAALRAPYDAFVTVDVLLGIYNVVGFGLLLTGYLLPQQRPLPLRPGFTFAQRWSIAPMAGANAGVSLAYLW